MSVEEILALLRTYGVVGVAILVVVYVLLFPDRAKQVSGWIWSLGAKLWKALDKRAVASRVEGDINRAQNRLLRHAPASLFRGKLRIKWSGAEEAKAAVENGQVVVLMRRSDHHSDNVVHALMAYLPKAVIARSRRYIGEDRMRAADLTLAKAFVTQEGISGGVEDVFLTDYLEPARKDVSLEPMIQEMDEIDLHGWLLRVLLLEYEHLGHLLYPGDPDEKCKAEADRFARWLYALANRAPGDDATPLEFTGNYFRVGVVLVALRKKIEAHGLDPYINRAQDYLENGGCDSVYLFGRDDKIPSVVLVGEALENMASVAAVETFRYPLRKDFGARKLLRRHRAVVVRVRKDPEHAPYPYLDTEPPDVVELRDADQSHGLHGGRRAGKGDEGL